MKLAEALVKRKNLKEEIEELKQRAAQYAVVQEGNEKLGSAEDVLQKIGSKIKELKRLIVAINETNLKTVLEGAVAKTIMHAIAERDMLKLQKTVMDFVVNNVTSLGDRFSRNEIRMISTINVEKLRTQSDSLAKQYRLLDAEIQAKNWKTEIII